MENHFIKIQGKANIPEPLEIDKSYSIEADCSITNISKNTNEDGSYDITYKAEPLGVKIKKENGALIKASDPRKNSVKIRNYCFKIYSDEGYVEDFNSVYDAVSMEILSRMPSLVREAVKRLNK